MVPGDIQERMDRELSGNGMSRIRNELTALSAEMDTLDLPCPGCDGDPFLPVVIRNNFRIVRCRACRSLYARPRPIEAQLARIYEKFPQLSNGREGQVNDDPEDGAREAKDRLSRLLQFVRTGHLLDIGSGKGDFLSAASRIFVVQGVDVAPRLRQEARGLPVFKGQLEEAAFPQASFDAVTAVEVFEHLFAPQRTLREIHRILKPNGVLLFQTGDADSFLARLNPNTWTYLEPPVHLNVFSRKALQDLAEKIGFKPLYSWSFDRAPQKLPILGGRRSSTAFRPLLDLAARQGLIGATFVWRKG